MHTENVWWGVALEMCVLVGVVQILEWEMVVTAASGATGDATTMRSWFSFLGAALAVDVDNVAPIIESSIF